MLLLAVAAPASAGDIVLANDALSLAIDDASGALRRVTHRRSGKRRESELPSITPGIEPTSRAASKVKSTLPMLACPSPASSASGTAWAMSVPTICTEVRCG